MGVTLGETCVPEWVGYCVWVGCWMLVCTMVPLIEYFATYRVTMQMQRFGYFIGNYDNNNDSNNNNNVKVSHFLPSSMISNTPI